MLLQSLKNMVWAEHGGMLFYSQHLGDRSKLVSVMSRIVWFVSRVLGCQGYIMRLCLNKQTNNNNKSTKLKTKPWVVGTGTGGLSQWLRVLALFPGTQVQFPAPMLESSHPPEHQLICIWCPLLVSVGTHTHTQRCYSHTHMHADIKIILEELERWLLLHRTLIEFLALTWQLGCQYHSSLWSLWYQAHVRCTDII